MSNFFKAYKVVHLIYDKILPIATLDFRIAKQQIWDVYRQLRSLKDSHCIGSSPNTNILNRVRASERSRVVINKGSSTADSPFMIP